MQAVIIWVIRLPFDKKGPLIFFPNEFMYFFQTTKDSCFKKCTKMADPVCVNNHIEYINECQMEVITCQDDIQVNIKTKGRCPPEPCDSRGE